MTPMKEDYIQEIYRLMEEQGYGTNIDLSRRLEVSKPSVTEMIKKLVKEGIVTTIERQIYLTEEGINLAKNRISKHRLWEYFLKEVLDFQGDFHQQAHLLEHVTSKELFELLNEYLNYPSKCPHGSAIYENQKTKDEDQKIK